MTPQRPTSPFRTHNGLPRSMQRAKSPSLRLNSLPRFHPANFSASNPLSNTSSAVNSPSSNMTSPTAPLSPRQQHPHQHANTSYQRSFPSDPQRHLQNHQREVVKFNRFNISRPTSPMSTVNPHVSMHITIPPSTNVRLQTLDPIPPRIDPLISPGPVTPLELEEHEGYMFPIMSSPGRSDTASEEGKDEERREMPRPTSPIPIYGSRATAWRAAEGRNHRSGLSR